MNHTTILYEDIAKHTYYEKVIYRDNKTLWDGNCLEMSQLHNPQSKNIGKMNGSINL